MISAVTFMSGVRHGDTQVEYELDTETWLGPYAPTATPYALAEQVGELLVESGLRARTFPDLRPAHAAFHSAPSGAISVCAPRMR